MIDYNTKLFSTDSLKNVSSGEVVVKAHIVVGRHSRAVPQQVSKGHLGGSRGISHVEGRSQKLLEGGVGGEVSLLVE